MNQVTPEMKERDADLGFLIRYAQSIHKFLQAGGTLDPDASHEIKEANTLLQSAFVTIPKEYWK